MDITLLITFAGAIFAVAMALTVTWHAQRSSARWSHWSLALGLAVLGLESFFSGLSAVSEGWAAAIRWQDWRLLCTSLLPGIWLFFSLCYARGNYREFVVKWRFALVCAFLLPVGVAVLFYGKLVGRIKETDQLGLRLETPGLILHFLFLVTVVLVMMNLERTFRAAVGTMRWRIKFMVLGLGVLFAAHAYTSSQALLFRSINLSLQTVSSGALLLACLLILRSLLRPGHFDVHLYPSHTVLHNSLTVLLAGTYLVIVGVLAKIVAFLGGDASFAFKAFLVLVCLVLLTIIVMSDRVRLQTRRFVSRHFQRPLHDYRTVWRTFTQGTTRRVEQSDLCETIAKLVSETFQALSVTVWLVDERKDQLIFAASTSLAEKKGESLALNATDAVQVIGALSNAPGPIDLDSSKDIWAVSLRRLQPDEFRKGGNRIAVPMIAAGELLGVMTLGDRVGGVLFSLQDFDLLKSVSDQAAASLLNIKLSQRLSQAKQLEAFQAMSAFFVHDLKNTASTLSLMLQNLPVHFNDPQFRADTLRGISKTVHHINDLISRLGLLRKELTINPIESDLNQLVTETMASLSPGEKAGMTGSSPNPQPSSSHSSHSPTTFGFRISDLTVDLGPLPKVRLDPAQIQTVFTNLLFNARDASPPGAHIRVETRQHNGSVVLTVSDNGCGMTPEFVQNSLFRPFQTTKKQGIGIGMFQCKTIVEAHHGRIEVDSEPGKGTTFRVLLPVDQSSSSS